MLCMLCVCVYFMDVCCVFVILFVLHACMLCHYVVYVSCVCMFVSFYVMVICMVAFLCVRMWCMCAWHAMLCICLSARCVCMLCVCMLSMLCTYEVRVGYIGDNVMYVST